MTIYRSCLLFSRLYSYNLGTSLSYDFVPGRSQDLLDLKSATEGSNQSRHPLAVASPGIGIRRMVATSPAGPLGVLAAEESSRRIKSVLPAVSRGLIPAPLLLTRGSR